MRRNPNSSAVALFAVFQLVVLCSLAECGFSCEVVGRPPAQETLSIDGARPRLSIRASQMWVAVGSFTPALVTITRDGDIESVLAVQFSLGGSAILGADYSVSDTNQLTFLPGEVEKVIEIFADTNATIGAGILVQLSDGAFSIVGKPVVGLTVVSLSLPLPAVQIWTSRNAAEGAGDLMSEGLCVIYRDGPIGEDLRFPLLISGNAIQGRDYIRVADVITIPAGQVGVTVPVIPINNRWARPGRYVSIALQAGTNYIVTGDISEVLLVDDEPEVSVLDAYISEEDEERDRLVLTVTVGRTGDMDRSLLVLSRWRRGGAAAPGFLRRIRFAPGQETIDLRFALKQSRHHSFKFALVPEGPRSRYSIGTDPVELAF